MHSGGAQYPPLPANHPAHAPAGSRAARIIRTRFLPLRPDQSQDSVRSQVALLSCFPIALLPFSSPPSLTALHGCAGAVAPRTPLFQAQRHGLHLAFPERALLAYVLPAHFLGCDNRYGPPADAHFLAFR